MNFPKVITRLEGCDTTLTVTELATIFDVHFSTINRWLLQLDFPKPVGHEHTRLFRPDQVIDWTKKQQEEARGLLTLEQVCELVGIYAETWTNRVKLGTAPPPRKREIGSGRHLWVLKEVNDWLQKETGGFARPRMNKHSKQTPHGRRGPKQNEKIAASAH